MAELIVFNADEFASALGKTEPGDKIVYWMGHLAAVVGRRTKGAIRAHELHKATLDAWYEGRVHLVQRRIGDLNYQYIAVRCHAGRRPRPEGDSRWRPKNGADRRDREEGGQQPGEMEVAVQLQPGAIPLSGE